MLVIACRLGSCCSAGMTSAGETHAKVASLKLSEAAEANNNHEIGSSRNDRASAGTTWRVLLPHTHEPGCDPADEPEDDQHVSGTDQA